MASSGRSRKPLHPTNLHVNKALFPNDTVQSRLPDPSWLEHWLDSQISFDREWEAKVVKMILHNLSSLFELPIRTVQDLSRYRKQLSTLAACVTSGSAHSAMCAPCIMAATRHEP